MRKKIKSMVTLPVVCCCLLSPFSLAMAEESDEVDIVEVEVRSTVLTDYLVTTEVITAEKIKELGATNVAEAINWVPGLYVARADKNSRMVRIRGAATDQTKIYVDGMPLFPLSGIASNAASDLATIPVDNIEKIEIIKGPGPVQYGTDYKGGIILITTKNGQGVGQGSLHLSAGSHSAYDTHISYSGSEGNVSYAVTAGKRQTDGHLSNSESDTNYFNGKIKWDVGQDSALTLSGYYINTDREIANYVDQRTGQPLYPNTNWSGDTAIDGKRSTSDWKFTDLKQTNIALQFDEKANNRFSYNVKIYHVTDSNDLWVYNRNNASLGTDTYANPIWYRSGWSSKGNGMEFTGDLQANRNNVITFGVKYNKIDWDADENNSDLDEGGTDKRIGYYVQDRWQVDNKTSVTLGVRYDEAKQSYSSTKTGGSSIRNSSTIDATDPVLNITHQLDNQNALRFSAGKSHIFATAKQVSNNLIGGAAIPEPEKAKNYEIGWKHDFDAKSSLDVAVFKNKIDNRIDRRTSDKMYYNIAQTDIQGVELSYNRLFSERLKGFINYTYLDAEDTDQEGVKTKAVKLPDAILNCGLTYTVDKLQTTALVRAVGNAGTDDATYTRLGGYYTMDVEFKYRQDANTDYFLRVSNLFDHKYWETATYPSDGINFMVGANLKL